MPGTLRAMQIKAFLGLNNVTDPLRLGVGELVRADNVDITDTGALVKREGYKQARVADAITGSYNTNDFSRLYTVEGGALTVVQREMSSVVLVSGLDSAPMHWTEVNNQVFFNNGVDSGIINADHSVLPWAWPVPAAPSLRAQTGQLDPGLYQVRCAFVLPDGRVTGASDASEIEVRGGASLLIVDIPQLPGHQTAVYVAPANASGFYLATLTTANAFVWNQPPEALGAALKTIGLDPLPLGTDCVVEWGGCIYASSYFPQDGQSAVWRSQPLGFHLFNLAKDVIPLAGRVLMLAPTATALLIGTDQGIYAYDGQNLTQLADYGVVPGQHWALDGARTLFWSTRGLCAALPFVNLIENRVSVPPGSNAGGALVQRDGRKRYLVALQQGGAAFNPRKETP